MKSELYIGLMSGTSIDGIDAALVSFESAEQLTVVDKLFCEFSDDIRQQINHAAQNNSALFRNQDSELHNSLAPVYAKAVEQLIAKSGIAREQISGVANHGQTVKHEPNAKPPYSLQLGDGQIIADLTGITTYSQFRQADLLAGGQGAPLMPAFHNAIFNDKSSDDAFNGDTFIVNIGGISNISRLGPKVVGFDTGPGNVLLDQWIERDSGKPYDADGAWGASGNVNSELLAALLKEPYFSYAHPKSTGTDHFNLEWLERAYPKIDKISAADVQATLALLTAQTIASAIKELNSGARDARIYVCGGGARNQLIMQDLKVLLGEQNVAPSDTLGIPADWVEAVGFAWLGYCCKHSIKSNLPSVTGACEKVVLGERYLPRRQPSQHYAKAVV